jgi:RNA polymerase sigma factor (sigma-70 family)
VPYRDDSIAGRLLSDDLESLGQVIRWIAIVLASRSFWTLREEWPDLHQEIMSRVIDSLRRERFDATRDFRSYVQAIARYTALEALDARRHRHPAGSPERAAAGDTPEMEARLVSHQFARLALDQATEECRGLIKAYFFEQRSYAEIAAALDVPVGTVKSRLARCLDGIHRALGGGRSGRRPVRPVAT